MRLLHTSDWHLGRGFHGWDLLAAQRAALTHLVETVREEAVDVVVIAGDLYDRALPPAPATQLLDDTLWELAQAASTGVVAISGNHDSPARLTYGGRFLERSGVHLRTQPQRVAEPAIAVPGLVVYALPYLEPTLVATELPSEAGGHGGALGTAMDRVRADLQARPDTASVVVAHAWVAGATASTSERDISVGGVGQVPHTAFDNADYVALGHLHRPQQVTDTVRYSGSLLPYSFSEAGQDKVGLIVDVVPGGVEEVRPIVLPRPRDLVTIRGELDELLTSRAFASAEGSFVSAVVTDTVRPTSAMLRLQQRFPYAVDLTFAPQGLAAEDGNSYGQRVADRSDREIITLFVERVRGEGPSTSEQRVLDTAQEAARVGCVVRPHRLQVSAFGPFADTVVLDLDALSDQGLFLLHGATGAGKTSLLDAMGYAIYGELPGARRSDDVRCRYAGAGTATQVVLEATVRGRRLRWTRSPQWQRPKARGDGMTLQRATVVIEEWLGGQWQGLTTRPDEAGLITADAVGLTAKQFFQVVLLPQGQFARFLQADSSEREVLLSTLFDTSTFDQVTEWLLTQRAHAQQECAEASATVAELVARICETSGAEAPVVELAQWAQTLVDAAEATATQLRSGLATATEHASTAAQSHAAAITLAHQHRQLTDLRARQSQLLAQDSEIGKVRERLLDAERSTVAVLAAHSAQDALALASTTASDAAAALSQLPEEHRDGDPGALAARWQERIGVLSEQATAWERLGERNLALEERRLVIPLLSEAAITAGARAASGPLRRQSLTKALGLSDRLAELASAVDTREREVKLTAQRDETHLAYLACREARLGAKEEEQTLREVWLSQTAGRLALALAVGQACCVCGSMEHPRPAAADSAVLSDLEITAAAERTEQLFTEEQVLQASHAELAAQCREAELSAQRLAGPGLLDETAIASAMENLSADIAALLAEASVAEVTSEALDALEAELIELQTQAEQAGTALAAASASLHSEEQALAQDSARFEGDPAVELATVTDLILRATSAAVAAGEAAAARDKANDLAAQAGKAALAAGFDDVAQALAASLTDGERESLRMTVTGYEHECATLEGSLAQLGPVTGSEPTGQELALSAEAEVAARAAENALTADLALALAARQTLGARVPALLDALDALDPVRAAHEEIAALAELAQGRGANALRMSLTTFVLAARLEDVCVAANTRLTRMTDGRYRLVHDDSVVDKRSRHGLGLAVDDAWTGSTRPASGLSGGETFLASLALALGLADVVTAEAGATRLDALFIDEGFGSLDPAALDSAMDVLDELRSGGRAVGVVSHVAELRERIPTQIRVHRSRTGSTLDITLS